MVKGMEDSCRDMRTDPKARYAKSHSTHDGGRSGIGGTVPVALLFAGLLVAASVPVLALAVCLGALVPTVVRNVRRRLAPRQVPTATTVVTGTPPRQCCEPSE